MITAQFSTKHEVAKPVHTEGHELDVKNKVAPILYDYALRVLLDDEWEEVWNIDPLGDRGEQKTLYCLVDIKRSSAAESIPDLQMLGDIRELHDGNNNIHPHDREVVTNALNKIQEILEHDLSRAKRDRVK